MHACTFPTGDAIINSKHLDKMKDQVFPVIQKKGKATEEWTHWLYSIKYTPYNQVGIYRYDDVVRSKKLTRKPSYKSSGC